MKIANATELGTTPLREAALKIAEAGLRSLDTVTVIEKNLKIDAGNLTVFGQTYKLHPEGRLFSVAIGKCAADAAQAIETVLAEKLSSGIALGVGDTKRTYSKFKYYSGTHPLPSLDNVNGSKAIISSLQGLKEKDTVLFLISGGGSTLLSLPVGDENENEKNIEKEKNMVKELFSAGATIQELNTLRKHMSLARGGHLAKYAYPAQVISMIFSDVPGNDLGFISSGPTIKDTTTLEDVGKVLKKYHLNIDIGQFVETPKDDIYFEKVYNMLTVSSEYALREMKLAAEKLGYSASIKNTAVTGEAREAAKIIMKEINAAPEMSVFLYSGETTVTIKVPGRGGRNQEFALAALDDITPRSLLLSLASDGQDNSPYAGAIADHVTREQAEIKSVKPKEYLDTNQSSLFFETVGGLIRTGPTGSNVSDLIIAMNGPNN